MIDYCIKILSRIIKALSCIVRALEKSHKNNHSKPWYYVDDIERRDALILEVYKGIATGRPWFEAILNPRASNHGERVAEYAFISYLLEELKPSSILDVGCVLNNPIISDFVKPRSLISFLNPAQEKVIYQKYGYFKFPLMEWTSPLTFSLVTCLSTIEHMGFDNTRYGVDEADQGWDWSRCVEEVIRSVDMLLSMTATGGTMVASCPYGLKEYVLMPPKTGVRTAQVLHMGHVAALRKEFGSRIEIITLRLSEVGWEPCLPDDEFQSYGAVGPGASGLILIVGKKT